MWGKVLGACFGFMFGRFFGLFLGLFIGHLFDKSLKQDFDNAGGFRGFFNNDDVSERQALFFSSCFAMMGHIAKSNGRVNELHIRAATAFMEEMGLTGEDKREAQLAFNAGKADDFSMNVTLREFREHFAGRFDLIQLFLEIQIQMAFSDGHLAAQEKVLLEQVAKGLGVSKTHFSFILKRYQAEFAFRQQQQRFHQQHQQQRTPSGASSGMSRAQALHILGLEEGVDASTVKKAYRKLMAQHHPDKLVSQGLPEHMMRLAQKKSQDIQAAYEYLKKAA
ncbi:co-chaperone DjlA [Pseudoalteromonas sp. BDTF-M6]|uniref:co-chaperone DjlA n=1 Tax=Pseudoalteromonas sp. BDTF-M6 TaxID=2796132 RepID=UPI001BB04FF4|nr:co-chaperone DjlA [Pseudoalteromonas sp. BDTF-M6]MBS3798269.1 co-chaperone DjlA [Pseudoalteromonas sp. BDTF-M6]